MYAWVKSVADGYALYIAADGKIVANQNCKNMFHGQYDTAETDIYSHVTSIRFNNAPDTSHATEMDAMFFMCGSLTTIDFSGFDTSNVTDMEQMFYDCQSLTTLDLRSFFGKSLEYHAGIFSGTSCKILVDPSKFTVPVEQ